MARRALLLGIDAYREPGLAMPAARADVKDLAEALVLAGFEPNQVHRAVGGHNDEYLSTKNLRRQVRQFLEGAGAGDELLIYFSGHGVEWDGHRLLIPQDYDREEPSPRHELFGDLDLYALARSRQCAADSVAVVFDACREDIRLDVVERKSPDAPPSLAPDRDSPAILFIFSCAAGEYSQANNGAEPYSFFTRALCEALKADDTFTIEELCAAVQTRLNDTLHPLGLHQTLTLGELKAAGRGGDPLKVVLKESPAARLLQQFDRSDWVRKAAQGLLWARAAAASPGAADQLRTLILRAEGLYREARERLPRQRWGDDQAPARVLRRLEILLGDRLDAMLRPAEALVAVAVPYLYEAMLAAAQLNLLAHGDPLAPDGFGPQACRMALALRRRFLTEAAWERRRALLRGRGDEAAADDLAAWQLLRFLHESGELWDYAPGRPVGARGWVNDRLDPLLAPAPLPSVLAEPRVGRILDGTRLVPLARLAFAGFEDIRIETGREGPKALDRNRCFGEGRHPWCLDEVKIAHLLNLGFRLALDPRRLPPVLAEHLGMDTLMTAESLHRTLAGAEWQGGSPLVLALDCPHEALDAALETAVRDLAEHLHRIAREQVLAPDLLALLPGTVSDKGVRPVQDGDNPRYGRPHLGFSMDQGRVRELLMGENLYGDPGLALRELYQNALDACRYRRTRERWLRATGQLGEDIPVYAGRIRLGAGQDQGRAYVECEDDGIGMTEKHLGGLFARAGRRFADSHEFHLEQADWDAAGIPFYPNSRFGIGVLSYFMLADEVLVESRRLSADGAGWEQGIRARVVGSGSLFRVQPLGKHRQGTRVRLYLNDPGTDPARLLDEVREWLWVPEFETEVAGTETLRLAAGEHGPRMVEECGALVPIPMSVGDAGQVRAWWSEVLARESAGALVERITYNRAWKARGIVLADGIRIARKEDPQVAGLAVNLTEAQRPAGLSVDRNRVTEWSEGRSWAASLVADHGWRPLMDLGGVGLATLGALFLAHPVAIGRLDSALRHGEFGAGPQAWQGSEGGQTSLAVGLFEADPWLDPDSTVFERIGVLSWNRITTRILRGRLGALIRGGLEVPAPLLRLVEYRDPGLNPPLGVWTLATRYLPADVQTTPNAEDRVPVGLIIGLCDFARDCAMSIDQAIALARDHLGLGLAPANWDLVPRGLELGDRALRLLSRNLDGAAPWLDAIGLVRIAVASADWGMAPRKVAALARPLAALGVGLPDPDSVPPDLRMSPDQRVLFSRDLDGHAPWIDEPGPLQVLRAAQKLSMPVTQVLEIARPFAGPGFSWPEGDALPPGFSLDERLLRLLSRDFDAAAPWRDVIGPARVLRAAKAWSLSVDAVLDLARPLAGLGIGLPDPGLVPRDLALNERKWDLLESIYEAPGAPSPGALARFAARHFLTLEEVTELAAPLAPLGPLPHWPVAAEPWLQDRETVRTLARLETAVNWEGGVLDPLPLAYHCVAESKDPSELLDVLGLLKALGIDVDEAIAYAHYCAEHR